MSIPSNLAFIGGCVRPDQYGAWSIQNDTDHAPLNLYGVSIYGTTTPRCLKLDFSVEYQQVVSLLITPDDDLTKAGITVGNNMGKSGCLIVFMQNGSQIDPASITVGNLWVSGSGYTS